MKTLSVFLIAVFLVFSCSVFAQSGLTNAGNTILISNGAYLKVMGNGGNFTNDSFAGINGKVDNNGTVDIEGDWTNNAGNSVFINPNDTGYVVLGGSFTQDIGGTGNSTRFENLWIDNALTDAVHLTGNNDQLTGNLVLLNGIITTGSNFIVVDNDNQSSLSGYNSTNFINGNLRRYIVNNTDTYAFPVGNGLASANYYPAELLNGNLTGVSYIDAYFGALANHNDIDMNVSEAGMDYYSIGTDGVWFLTPDAAATGGSFDLRCYIDNFTGLYDNRFAILSRPDNSLTGADWDCTPCGIGNPGISPADGEGRLLSNGYALRRGYSGFSQFGIAKVNCEIAQLPADTTVCSGESIVLWPGDFNSYLWSTGSTDSAIVATASGQYFVDVVNSNAGCSNSSDTINITVTVISYISQVQDVSCFGYNDGQINITPAGGTPDYHYTWNPALSDTSHVTGLSPISYALTITDANGCVYSVPKIQINQPDSLYYSASVTDPMCFGLTDGQIMITPYGGTPPYNYAWSTGGSASAITGLASGNYSLTLTDDNNCPKTESFTLADASQLVVTGQTGVSDSYSGYINTTIQGGTAPYSYTWSDGQTTENAAGLNSGDYSVTVTDFYGCLASGTWDITIPLFIPSVFTPNNDGHNDTWDIINIESYSNVSIQIFNRWGDVVFEFSGTGDSYGDVSEQWDGTWNGKELPFGAFVYIVDLDSGSEIYNGVVTIKK
ncbi:MAG: gliding motility-associated C-terminal domain-containing protein [Bacteroidota bacterium]